VEGHKAGRKRSEEKEEDKKRKVGGGRDSGEKGLGEIKGRQEDRNE
jgi:hypothetical protein